MSEQRWLRRTVPLSPLPGERALQRWIITLASWFVLCGAVDVLATHGADTADFDQYWPARLAAGAVAVVIAGWAHVLITRHREAIATVWGLQRQFATVGETGLVLGVVGLVPWWWAGPVVALVSIAAWVRVRRVRTVPLEEMTEPADHETPHRWSPRGRFAHRPGPHLATRIGGAVLAGLLLAAAFLGALLLGSHL